MALCVMSKEKTSPWMGMDQNKWRKKKSKNPGEGKIIKTGFLIHFPKHPNVLNDNDLKLCSNRGIVPQ